MAGQSAAKTAPWKNKIFAHPVTLVLAGALGVAAHTKPAHATSVVAGGSLITTLTHSQIAGLNAIRAQGFYIDDEKNPGAVPESARSRYAYGAFIYKKRLATPILQYIFGLTPNDPIARPLPHSAVAARVTKKQAPVWESQVLRGVSDSDAAAFEKTMTVPSSGSDWFWKTQAVPAAKPQQPATITHHVKPPAPPAPVNHSEIQAPSNAGAANANAPATYTIIGCDPSHNASASDACGPHSSIDLKTGTKFVAYAAGTALLYLKTEYELAAISLSYDVDQQLPKLLETPASAALADRDADKPPVMSIQQAWGEARRVMLKRNKSQATDADMNRVLAQMTRSIIAHAFRNPQTTFEATQYVLNKIVKQGFTIENPGALFDVIARRDAAGNVTDDFIATISNEKSRRLARNYVMKMNKLAVLAV